MKSLLSALLILFFAVSAFAVEVKEDYADFNGQKVYFKSIGKGKKVLVFVHCWTCNSEFWKDSYNAFPEYRVIALDLIGHGKSDKPRTDYTMEYLAQSVEAVLKKAKVKEAVLVGHSMGTPVVRQFYRLYPKQTKGLIIVDGGLRPFAPKSQLEQFFAPLKTNYSESASKFIDGMLETVSPNLKSFIRTSMLSSTDYVAVSAMDGMIDENIYKTDKINVPTLAILAESSFGSQKDLEPFLRSLIPNLNLVMWKGVSHFLHLERPREFNAEVKNFIVKNNLL